MILTSEEDNLAFERGMSLFRAAKYLDAEVIFADLARRNPGSKRCRILYGWTVMERNGFAEAEQIFRELVRDFPLSEKSSLGLFHVLWDLGRQVEALEEMKRYISKNPESEEYQTLRRELVDEIDRKTQ